MPIHDDWIQKGMMIIGRPHVGRLVEANELKVDYKIVLRGI